MVILGILGLLGILVSIIMLVISLIKKNGKAKVWGLGIVASVVIAISGIAFSANENNLPADSASAGTQPVSTSQKTNNTNGETNTTSTEASKPEFGVVDKSQIDTLNGKVDTGYTYDDFISFVGVEGELVYDRDGVKTYSYKIKEDPNNEARFAFDGGKLFGVYDGSVPEGGGVKSDDYSIDTEEEDSEEPDADLDVGLTTTTFTVDGVNYKGYYLSDKTVAIVQLTEADSVGDDLWNAKAKGVFLVVAVSIWNPGKEAITINDDEFKLIDAAENEYSVSDDASTSLIALDMETFSYTDINPNMGITGLLVFDVPKNTEFQYLKITSGFFDSGTSIPLKVQTID